MNAVYERDLDLNLLRVFAVVAEEGSVTRAAARLYLTQPAVSASLRRLATFVGAPLFARQGRGIVLTARGSKLLAASQQHLRPLVEAVMAPAAFDPATSTATVRLGLPDASEGWALPRLLAALRAEAPGILLVVVPVQFRTVEEALLSRRVDLALCVADQLPRAVLRKPLSSAGFVCVYDPRHARLPKRLTERAYFAHEHVVVSYAGDAQGIVEDALGKSRRVRVSVPTFAYVGAMVEGSSLLATVPAPHARYLRKTHPVLREAALPFALPGAPLELLWLRAVDDDPVSQFVRGLVERVLSPGPSGSGQVRSRRGAEGARGGAGAAASTAGRGRSAR